MIADWDALLAPLGAAAFFAEYYEKKHLHLRRSEGVSMGLLTPDELFRALAHVREIPDRIVCFPEQVDTTRTELLTNESRLQAYLEAGHPIVWNRARGISRRIDEMSALLAQVFGGHVWPNVYATGDAGTPFDMHFDAHEVLAIHCAGEKTWEISRVRVDRPLEAVEMAATIRHVLEVRRDEAAANVLDSFTVCPGDIVYIPRGQFHNARTQKGRSLHVTFGIELPTGFDLAKRILSDLLGDPMLREYPIPQGADVDGAFVEAWCAQVASRLTRSFSLESVSTARRELQERWVAKSS